MTVNDMLEQFEIQGVLRVQCLNNETDDMDIYYESDDCEHALVNRGYEWLNSEVKYMYPSTTYNRDDVEIPQIVIEIEIEY